MSCRGCTTRRTTEFFKSALRHGVRLANACCADCAGGEGVLVDMTNARGTVVLLRATGEGDVAALLIRLAAAADLPAEAVDGRVLVRLSA